eukprot:1160021-Pelagomonas_calceolata.AAC.8
MGCGSYVILLHDKTRPCFDEEALQGMAASFVVALTVQCEQREQMRSGDVIILHDGYAHALTKQPSEDVSFLVSHAHCAMRAKKKMR